MIDQAAAISSSDFSALLSAGATPILLQKYEVIASLTFLR
jgi:hypothetical protein